MIVRVSDLLKKCWRSIKDDHEFEIHKLLGGFTFLLFVALDRHLIMTLLKFWDPARLVFKFTDFELIPTTEEVGGSLTFPIEGVKLLCLTSNNRRSF